MDADVSKDRSFFQMSRFVGSTAHPDIPEVQISQLCRPEIFYLELVWIYLCVKTRLSRIVE